MVSIGSDGYGVGGALTAKGSPGLRIRGFYIEDPESPKGVAVVNEFLTNLLTSRATSTR